MRYFLKNRSDLIQNCWLKIAGNISYELKTPYRDGTMHVVFEPLDFIGFLQNLLQPINQMIKLHYL